MFPQQEKVYVDQIKFEIGSTLTRKLYSGTYNSLEVRVYTFPFYLLNL